MFEQKVSHVGWTFWLQWILVNAVAGAIGGALSLVASKAMNGGATGGIVTGVVIGASYGIMQWLVLRRLIYGASWWVLASTVGGTVGGAVAYWVWIWWYEPIGMTLTMFWVGWAMAWTAMAASCGIMQWLVLRRLVYRAGWWVLVTIILGAVYGAVLGPVIETMFGRLNADLVAWAMLGAGTWWVGSSWIKFAAVSGVVSGVGGGAVTGTLLAWLWRHPIKKISKESRKISLGIRDTIRQIRQNQSFQAVVILSGILLLLISPFIIAIGFEGGGEESLMITILGTLFVILVHLPLLLIASTIVVLMGRLPLQLVKQLGVRGTIRQIRQNRFFLEVVTLAGIPWLLFFFLVVIAVPQDPEVPVLSLIYMLLMLLPILLIASAGVIFSKRLLIAGIQKRSFLAFVIVLIFGLIPPFILYIIIWLNSVIAGRLYIEPPVEAEVAARLKTADIAGLFIKPMDAEAEIPAWLKTAKMTRVNEHPLLQEGKAMLAKKKIESALQAFIKGLATAHQQSRNIRAEVIEELWSHINEIYERRSIVPTVDTEHYHDLVERYWEHNDWFVSTIEAYPHASPVAKESGKEVPDDVLAEIRTKTVEVQQLHEEIQALVKQLPSLASQSEKSPDVPGPAPMQNGPEDS